MNNNLTKRTHYMVEVSLMAAIIILMAFTPLGYIRTPGLSITLLTIPVAVAAIILGPAAGAICGAVFGATSFAQCFGMTPFGTMLFQINPFGAFFTCVIPRILEGFLCGLIFQSCKKMHLKNTAYYIASLSCPLLNTLLFMSSLVIIFYRSDYIQGFVSALGVSNPLMFVLAFVGLQGLIEAVICFFIASIVSRTLAAALKQN